MAKNKSNVISALLAEYVFAIMPMIVLGFLLVMQSKLWGIYYTKDWSFISMLLIGQVITKFNTGMLKFGERVSVGAVSLLNAIVICFLFIPVVMVFCGLSMFNNPCKWLYHAQMILFLLSSAAFLFFTIFPEITEPPSD